MPQLYMGYKHRGRDWVGQGLGFLSPGYHCPGSVTSFEPGVRPHTLSAQGWGGSRSETNTMLWYKELDTSLLWEELSSGIPGAVS